MGGHYGEGEKRSWDEPIGASPTPSICTLQRALVCGNLERLARSPTVGLEVGERCEGSQNLAEYVPQSDDLTRLESMALLRMTDRPTARFGTFPPNCKVARYWAIRHIHITPANATLWAKLAVWTPRSSVYWSQVDMPMGNYGALVTRILYISDNYPRTELSGNY